MPDMLRHGSWGTVDFMLGRASNYFEFCFDPEALVEFIKLSFRALHELGHPWPGGR